MKTPLCIGSSLLRTSSAPVSGRWVRFEGATYYRIANYDRMRPFFMSVVSASDHWLFISSTGALTAGRRTPDLALFPYYTEDKIHDSAGITGSLTVVRVRQGNRVSLWEPFSSRHAAVYRKERSLYKHAWGHVLMFEEINHDLGLTFRYRWSTSNRFGFVRDCTLLHQGPGTVEVVLLDGLQNLLPWGVGSQFQLDKSVLLDAYKRSELLPGCGLALFRLSSIPIDRPEPAEALRTSVAWSLGLPGACHLLSTTQLEPFRTGAAVREECDIRAERGAYLLQSRFTLRPGEARAWTIVADVNRGPSDVVGLAESLRRPARLRRALAADVRCGGEELRAIIAGADGLQLSGEPLADARHANNVLANVMRGGVFDQGYRVDPEDLAAFVRQASPGVASRHASLLRKLPEGVSCTEVVQAASAAGDPQLERLCREYLPLTFSRRHGDPSRPWNRFSIAARLPDGRRELNYEGNWRDIFQNWEALAVSYPAYLPGMISRFLSASTADGYNPYRITRNGIDWEVPDPHDPWAHIGYWGDHQLIYLLKLLELLHQHDPETLQSFLTRRLFAFANVPYRIKPYEQLLADPKHTVLFDQETEALVRRRVQTAGADGRLLWNRPNEVQLGNLTEKLLVAALAKLTNFIPDAGIWLNTQRPEWNDANNALVGQGVSMVTLCHLRRYLEFCRHILRARARDRFPVASEIAGLLNQVDRALRRHQPLLARGIRDTERKQVLDALGRAGSKYRQSLYRHGLSGREQALTGQRLLGFLGNALAWMDHSIAANRRSDGLYHAYNLARFEDPKAVGVRRLYEMLEGQVAVLSSGRLDPAEAARLLEALRRSSMFRPDQHSYLLYPNRELPRFTERNNLSARSVAHSPLLRALVAAGDRTVIERDVRGQYHFAGGLTSARDLERALEQLATRGYDRLVRREACAIVRRFETLFDHESFTGRSGTFFAYEGLGSIYWHMVSKLLLAAQETCLGAADQGASAAVQRRLQRAYRDIRAGLGDRKSPAVYGAFPMDPYSHTPAHTGARQPGLTGQVKEDILCRFGELGLEVADGCLSFRPRLLRPEEFLATPSTFEYVDVAGTPCRVRLAARSLAFTCCQVPIVYRLGDRSRTLVLRSDGTTLALEGTRLDGASSRSLFERRGEIERITVFLKDDPGKARR